MTLTYSSAERLQAHHELGSFSCGRTTLDEWLKRHALVSQEMDITTTYVVCHRRVVVAYYSLCASSISMEDAAKKTARGLPKRAIPALLLARLAIDTRHQGCGLGKALLKYSLARCVSSAEVAAARIVMVDALDGKAKQFYCHFGFLESPTNSMRLMMRMKEIRALLGIKAD